MLEHFIYDLDEPAFQQTFWTPPRPARVLNFGAGTQSSVLLFMAMRGEIEADRAVFADTGWERQATYEWVDFCRHQAEAHGFPLEVVRAGDIRRETLAALDGERFAALPFYVYNEEGEPALLKRQCTREYKIDPIMQAVRRVVYHQLLREAGVTSADRRAELVDVIRSTWGALPDPAQRSIKGIAQARVGRHVRCEQLFGITTDELERVRDSRYSYVRNRYPLIERGMSRQDCIDWLAAEGLPQPGKSACIGCPFHDNDFWRELRSDEEEWQDAVAFDRRIRTGLRGVKSTEAYLHPDRVPLDQVDLDGSAENGMVSECEGMCGV